MPKSKEKVLRALLPGGPARVRLQGWWVAHAVPLAARPAGVAVGALGEDDAR
jgi:hypothetical protein